jgi:hypothetical protein
MSYLAGGFFFPWRNVWKVKVPLREFRWFFFFSFFFFVDGSS